MTVHIAINGWFWDQPNTGSGQYVRELLRALCQIDRKNQYTLVLPAHITPEAVPEAVNIVQTGGGVPGKLGKVWFEQRQYPAAVGQCGADIAHVPYWGPPLSSPAKLVTSVLDVVPLLFPEYAQGVATQFYTSLVRAAAQGSAYIITLSAASKQDIAAQFDYPPERIVPVHLAPKADYHPQIGAERDAAVREKYNLPADDPFILYLGGFDSRKQLEQLFAAYTFVVRAHGEFIPLVLAGREPAWGAPLFPNMREYAAEMEIPDESLLWIGYVDEADKPSLYRLARVFAFPSAYEGFGLPVLEAMASGTPVVANEIPVFDELVADGAFLIEPGSATKMGGAIMALLEQDDLYESVRNAGAARATNFTWRKTARETLTVYERALAYTDG